jgi:hypothetical protein
MWLKLRWARFFTLAGWQWRLAPRPGFDFQVTLPCDHSECAGGHILVVRVTDKPRWLLEEKYRAFAYPYREPSPALFGDGPENTFWTMLHGHGGGDFDITCFASGANRLWEVAARG